MFKEMYVTADANSKNMLEIDGFRLFCTYYLSAFAHIKVSKQDETMRNIFTWYSENPKKGFTVDEFIVKLEPILDSIAWKAFRFTAQPGMNANEFKDMVKEIYDIADINNDDILIQEEYEKFCRSVVEAIQPLSLAQHDKCVNDLNEAFEYNLMGVLCWEDIWAGIEPIGVQIEQKNFRWRAAPKMGADNFKAMIMKMYQAADTNHNGVLEPEEFKHFTLFVLEAIKEMNLSHY